LFALIPVATSILLVYSAMVLLSIPLGIGTSMFAAVAIGLGVDFAIHTIDRLRSLYKEEQNMLASIQRFYPNTGRALLFNLLAIALGFGVLISSKVVPLRRPKHGKPTIVNGKVTPPPRRRNKDVRSREHLTPDEVGRLMASAKSLGRHGHRDSTLVLLAYRHGLRVSELVALRWDMVDLKQGLLHVSRLKNGVSSTHPVRGPELRALRKLQRDYPDTPYLFVTERKGPLTTSTVRKLLARAGEHAEIGLPVHPHMLRHSTGYKLANDGHDTRAIQHYLGHRNIQHTVRYTELAAGRFKDFWKD
jgi:integrase